MSMSVWSAAFRWLGEVPSFAGCRTHALRLPSHWHRPPIDALAGSTLLSPPPSFHSACEMQVAGEAPLTRTAPQPAHTGATGQPPTTWAENLQSCCSPPGCGVHRAVFLSLCINWPTCASLCTLLPSPVLCLCLCFVLDVTRSTWPRVGSAAAAAAASSLHSSWPSCTTHQTRASRGRGPDGGSPFPPVSTRPTWSHCRSCRETLQLHFQSSALQKSNKYLTRRFLVPSLEISTSQATVQADKKITTLGPGLDAVRFKVQLSYLEPR